MEREDIEKVAKDYAQQKYCSEDNDTPRYMIAQIHAARDGFIDGANWRIDSVWHVANEIPEYSDRFILVESIRYDGAKCYNVICSRNYNKHPFYEKWAYIKDLIPNK